jgi:hypothetical protein
LDIDPSTTSQAEICHSLEIAPGISMCSKGPMCPLECHSLEEHHFLGDYYPILDGTKPTEKLKIIWTFFLILAKNIFKHPNIL